jgi:hypothetical protein
MHSFADHGETLERWLGLAERLQGKELPSTHVGNDDEPVLREVLASSPLVVDQR